ncbi:MFS transporter [Chthonobacter rhizosphaerae]|uniref:MFS transporter n=1 Tax=Chthonobacter rhizosphaerae TaxID=2735553 RepID=UPI0015EE3B52
MTAVPADTLDSTRRLGIAAAIGATTAVGTSLGLGLPLLAIVLESRGISSSAIGINTAMAGVAALAVTPFVARFARAVGAAQLLLLALLVATAAFPLFFLASDLWMWFPLRFVFHGAITMAFVLSEFWINALAPDGKRGLILGIYATVLSLGFSVGPAVLGLVGTEGFMPFALGTMVLGLSAVPVLFALRANPPMEEKPRGNFLRYLTLVPLATFAGFTFGATDSGILGFIALYGLRLGYDTADAALMVSAVAIGNVVSQIPLGLLADRVDRRKLLAVIAAIATVGMALLPTVADDKWLTFGLLTVWGGVVAGLYTVGLVHLGARLKGSDLAAANAGFVFMYALGMLVGPALVGAGMDAWNPHGLAVVEATILAAYTALAVWRIATTSNRNA